MCVLECLNIFYNEKKTDERFRVIFAVWKKEPDSMRKRRISSIHIEYLLAIHKKSRENKMMKEREREEEGKKLCNRPTILVALDMNELF